MSSDATLVQKLEQTALKVRKVILRTTHHAGCGHTGGSLSEADILTALYFHILRIDPAYPRDPKRDRFILSKGHSTPGYYTALALRGFFPEEELLGFDSLGSILQGHPDMHKTPGVDISTGSLGQGLSLGIGMALGGERNGYPYRVFVLLGDGESQEGQVWEAAQYAGSHRVKRIIGITDYNKVQLADNVKNTSDMEPLADKWKAFNWRVFQCDGHNMKDLLETLEQACTAAEEGPVMLLANTVKGKGVSFMEGTHAWHGKAPNDEEYKLALEELALGEEALDG
ncbi:MAG: transketolase [Spirochaetales bacterium]|nr:transketolase [Spirochaetales bacterium]